MNKKITLLSALAFYFFASERFSAQETNQNKPTNDTIASVKNEATNLNVKKNHSSDDNTFEIHTVEIIGRKERGYKNTKTFSATKTDVDLMDVPQSINYVTKETLDDQAAFKTSDAVKNISGVNQSSYNNNDFVLRGFRASNTLINGQRISTRGWAQNLTPYVERIEVIKGPASALFANTDPGGTINTVTKKPLKEVRNSVNFSTGSFKTNRILGDFTGPMNEKKTL